MSTTTVPFDRRGDSSQRIGRYELLSPIACGGMAELHLARARAVGGFEKLVALKRILPHVADQENYVAMFVDEARLAATLNHPNIAQVYDMGMHGDEFFFTMEFIAGRDLRHVMRRCRERGGALPLPVALTVLAEVARGLHYAHEKRDGSGRPLNIIHRDISPPNVIVTYDGGVKVVDFGIAKAASASNVTNTRTLKGKYQYMSPEQVKGMRLDRRSDIFALGILMWELTVREPLFVADTDFAVLNAIAYDPIPKPSSRVRDYPKKLEAIVMKALARDPDDRYETAEDVQVAIEELALKLGVRLSSVDVSRFMREVFHREADQWYQAEGAEDSRAEKMASYLTSLSGEENLSDIEAMLRLVPPMEQETAATQAGPLLARRQKRRPRPGLVAAAIVAVMIAALALIASQLNRSATAKAADTPAIEAVDAPATEAVDSPAPAAPAESRIFSRSVVRAGAAARSALDRLAAAHRSIQHDAEMVKETEPVLAPQSERHVTASRALDKSTKSEARDAVVEAKAVDEVLEPGLGVGVLEDAPIDPF